MSHAPESGSLSRPVRHGFPLVIHEPTLCGKPRPTAHRIFLGPFLASRHEEVMQGETGSRITSGMTSRGVSDHRDKGPVSPCLPATSAGRLPFGAGSSPSVCARYGYGFISIPWQSSHVVRERRDQIRTYTGPPHPALRKGRGSRRRTEKPYVVPSSSSPFFRRSQCTAPPSNVRQSNAWGFVDLNFVFDSNRQRHKTRRLSTCRRH